MAEERYSVYDPFALAYDRFWGDAYVGFMSTLDRLALEALPAGARILDLCCGTGQVAASLTARKFEVCGVDGSQAMIARARENAPEAVFEVADARNYVSEKPIDLVLSTYDSLNHIMDLDQMETVFGNVYQSLEPDGVFVFDLNDEEGFLARWHGSFGLVEDDLACIVRASYDLADKRGQTLVTMFAKEGEIWRRTEVELEQRCYQAPDVVARLAEVGFQEIHSYDSRRDLDLQVVGRRFYVARKLTADKQEDGAA